LGYNGIVTVGFLLADATKIASEANPDIPFAIVDFPSQTKGDMGLLFAVDEPSFMAGYLAAAMSEPGRSAPMAGSSTPVTALWLALRAGSTITIKDGQRVKLLGWKTDAAAEGGGDGRLPATLKARMTGGACRKLL
jgi:basic membrane protein A